MFWLPRGSEDELKLHIRRMDRGSNPLPTILQSHIKKRNFCFCSKRKKNSDRLEEQNINNKKEKKLWVGSHRVSQRIQSIEEQWVIVNWRNPDRREKDEGKEVGVLQYRISFFGFTSSEDWCFSWPKGKNVRLSFVRTVNHWFTGCPL